MPIEFINFDREDFLGKDGGVLHKTIPWEYAKIVMDGDPLNISFCTPSMWKDKWDSMFYSIMYRGGEEEEFSFPLKNRVLCSCFTSGTVSEGQWQIYSDNQKCVKFAIYKEGLLKWLEESFADHFDIYIAKVLYHETSILEGSINHLGLPKDADVLRKRDTQIRLLAMKRNAFGYENEIRVILVSKKKYAPSLLLMPVCEPACLIQSVIFSPHFETEEFDGLREAFAANLGKQTRSVGRSHLYDPAPKTFIRI